MRTSIITTIVVVLLLGSEQKTYAQAYTPLAVEGATWIMSGYGDYHFMGWGYRIVGDSTVNNEVYKKLYYYDLEVIDPDLQGDKDYRVISEAYAGLLRDDLTERKVYGYDMQIGNNNSWRCDSTFYVGIEEDTEILLYDFGKTKGDTLKNCMLEDTALGIGKEVVITIDTMGVTYNYFRRIIGFEPALEQPILVEGIGYTSGLLSTVQGLFHAAKGLGLAEYCIGTQWECGLTTAVKQTITTAKINIYPNPTLDLINIESEEPILNSTIYDMNAQLIIKADSQTQLNTSELTPGAYIMEIRLTDNTIYRTKLIKI